jgi:hypothetical protein
VSRRAWKPVTKYKVAGGWRHVAECTRCRESRGFSHPDAIKDAEPHDQEECDEVLKTRKVFEVMDG